MSKIKSTFSLILTLAIPLFYLTNLILIWKFQQTTSFPLSIAIVGVILALIGVLLWAVSFWELKSAFQVLPVKNKRIKKGIYRWLKHPMYIGIILTFIGLSLALQSKEGVFFTFFLTLPLLIIRAFFEEKKLTD